MTFNVEGLPVKQEVDYINSTGNGLNANKYMNHYVFKDGGTLVAYNGPYSEHKYEYWKNGELITKMGRSDFSIQ